ncbi:hypothetical protein CDAR_1561 [Caerostris darwini]|uniref:Uncharacterized protein n=1 Tax=Caerostris darwini TaxID=1538125 RepID=A0AAV4RAC1_9ARAC|nr:hypothetical protein CDAR_1561 [Caerostris darwini]
MIFLQNVYGKVANFRDIYCETSEKHLNMRNCLVYRVDSIKLLKGFHNPSFSDAIILLNRDIAGEAHVNCHFVQEVGMKRVMNMAARDKFMNVTFKK